MVLFKMVKNKNFDEELTINILLKYIKPFKRNTSANSCLKRNGK